MFSYDLPLDRIAQRPVGEGKDRARSKLLVARTRNGSVVIEDRQFFDLPNLLVPGDLLVLNNSRVVPSRFFAVHQKSGREIEILLVRLLGAEQESELWEALGRPLKHLVSGDSLVLSDRIQAVVGDRSADGRTVQLLITKKTSVEGFGISALLEADGIMPIPPYIRGGRADDADRESYQTVFSEERGSIAAPTAGLHFTPDVLSSLAAQGIAVNYITLHVGVGSFQPIDEHEPAAFKQAAERYTVPTSAADAIKEQKREKRRVIAVGTTVVRALESWALADPSTGEDFCQTNLFISPGFSFSIVDALITNFHQPRSTHLQLVSAFLGKVAIEQIYQHALQHEYRFLSYGDAMLLEP